MLLRRRRGRDFGHGRGRGLGLGLGGVVLRRGLGHVGAVRDGVAELPPRVRIVGVAPDGRLAVGVAAVVARRLRVLAEAVPVALVVPAEAAAVRVRRQGVPALARLAAASHRLAPDVPGAVALEGLVAAVLLERGRGCHRGRGRGGGLGGGVRRLAALHGLAQLPAHVRVGGVAPDRGLAVGVAAVVARRVRVLAEALPVRLVRAVEAAAVPVGAVGVPALARVPADGHRLAPLVPGAVALEGLVAAVLLRRRRGRDDGRGRGRGLGLGGLGVVRGLGVLFGLGRGVRRGRHHRGRDGVAELPHLVRIGGVAPDGLVVVGVPALVPRRLNRLAGEIRGGEVVVVRGLRRPGLALVPAPGLRLAALVLDAVLAGQGLVAVHVGGVEDGLGRRRGHRVKVVAQRLALLPPRVGVGGVAPDGVVAHLLVVPARVAAVVARLQHRLAVEVLVHVVPRVRLGRLRRPRLANLARHRLVLLAPVAHAEVVRELVAVVRLGRGEREGRRHLAVGGAEALLRLPGRGVAADAVVAARRRARRDGEDKVARGNQALERHLRLAVELAAVHDVAADAVALLVLARAEVIHGERIAELPARVLVVDVAPDGVVVVGVAAKVGGGVHRLAVEVGVREPVPVRGLARPRLAPHPVPGVVLAALVPDPVGAVEGLVAALRVVRAGENLDDAGRRRRGLLAPGLRLERRQGLRALVVLELAVVALLDVREEDANLLVERLDVLAVRDVLVAERLELDGEEGRFRLALGVLGGLALLLREGGGDVVSALADAQLEALDARVGVDVVVARLLELLGEVADLPAERAHRRLVLGVEVVERPFALAQRQVARVQRAVGVGHVHVEVRDLLVELHLAQHELVALLARLLDLVKEILVAVLDVGDQLVLVRARGVRGRAAVAAAEEIDARVRLRLLEVEDGLLEHVVIVGELAELVGEVHDLLRERVEVPGRGRRGRGGRVRVGGEVVRLREPRRRAANARVARERGNRIPREGHREGRAEGRADPARGSDVRERRDGRETAEAHDAGADLEPARPARVARGATHRQRRGLVHRGRRRGVHGHPVRRCLGCPSPRSAFRRATT